MKKKKNKDMTYLMDVSIIITTKNEEKNIKNYTVSKKSKNH